MRNMMFSTFRKHHIIYNNFTAVLLQLHVLPILVIVQIACFDCSLMTIYFVSTSLVTVCLHITNYKVFSIIYFR